MINHQKPLPEHINPNGVDIHEIFDSIQGEGPYSGEHAIFIRLTGCNLACPGCDTNYSSASYTTWSELDEILESMKNNMGSRFPKLVVVTGGEPFRQNTVGLVDTLFGFFEDIQFETNGTLEIPDMVGNECCIVCSPKGRIHPSVFKHCYNWKFVVDANDWDNANGLPIHVLDSKQPLQAEDLEKVLRERESGWRTIYIQPADVKDKTQNRRNMRCAVHICKTFNYRLNLQLHKYAEIE